MAELLNDDAVTEALRGLPGWERDGNTIVHSAKLPSFPAAIAVVDRVAELAERANHHPDIDIRWRTLTFRCSTHSEGGITDLDIALAAQISEQIRSAQS
ncbi:4a-hydroxytetrahydrobiopterin dehydratase [Pseudonocardia acaciae]|uniref:4a-hydroxytetrahydrobiopterin dehydratase n=1 Tax=Pseudonocardia acaciae TaxID=551276 RepID=UPI00048B1B93|nr:4a-hydroxytetrahydrobiopterin dehydratase [Pseudonocardia acaciae]